MKNILINIPDLSRKNGGVYQYSLALLNVLSKKNPKKYKFYILCNIPDNDLTKLVNDTNHFEFVKTKKPVYSSFTLYKYKSLNKLFKVFNVKKRFVKKQY